MKTYLYVIIALVCLHVVASIGVMPAGKLFDYEPGAEKSVTLTLINTLDHDVEVVVYASDPYQDSVKFSKTHFTLGALKKEDFQVYLTIPTLEPGVSSLDVVIHEILPPSSGISASSSVVASFRINVPYDGLYAKAVMDVDARSLDLPVDMVISVYNQGTLPIDELSGVVLVYSPTNELLATLKTQNTSLKTASEIKLVAQWVGVKNPGKYFAQGIITYGGKRLVVDEVFEIGGNSLVISNVVVDDFSLGQVAKATIEVFSDWNEDVPGVSAEVNVLDKTRGIVQSYTSMQNTIQAKGITKLIAYWETSGLEPGDYILHVSVPYQGKVAQKSYDVYIGIDEIVFTGTGLVSGAGAGSGSNVAFLTVLVFGLIIINIGLFIYFKNHLKK